MSASPVGKWASRLLPLLVLVVAAVVFWTQLNPGKEEPETMPLDEGVAFCRELVDRKRFDEAASEARELLAEHGDNPELLVIAGNASAAGGFFADAMDFYQRVPANGSPESVEAGLARANIEFQYGTLTGAERALQSVLKYAPENAQAHELMAQVLDLEGRRWEVVPHALEVIRQGNTSLAVLILLADQRQIIGRMAPMRAANDRDQSDPGPLLGLSRAAFWEGKTKEAEALTRHVISLRGDLLEAHVRLGDFVVAADSSFREWHSTLPAAADRHPDTWIARGRWAKRHGQAEAAARCFWEAARRNPNDATACNELAQLLRRLNRAQEAAVFGERGGQLVELGRMIAGVQGTGARTPASSLNAVANIMRGLGRTLEADHWDALAAGRRGPRRDGSTQSADDVLACWVDPDANPIARIDLSHFPLPNFNETSTSADDAAYQFAHARYEDLAEQVGLKFTYVPAPDPSAKGKRIIESTGGGVAALDFDLDGWPDVFFTQGGLQPVSDQRVYRDRLYRNLADRFDDVTGPTGIHGLAFGQGTAAGDVNSDGFPDLYVANLGRNRLYLNNGDGTFSQSDIGDQRTDWSTSVAIADVNGDTLPDIYVVNYLSGPEIFSLICEARGHALMCSPDVFPAAQDRILVNLGDGRFEDRTKQLGLVRENGKGLGILVADFDETGSLSFFVANDAVPNFCFAKPPDESPFVEVSSVLGVSISGEGVSQGCMGIAFGDADNDSRPDMFVTNFDGETNTLYLNLGGAFEDASEAWGLPGCSLPLVGFGTQFVDGELDGYADLLVVNGHVDDMSMVGRRLSSRPLTAEQASQTREAGYRMRPQYLRNVRGRAFEDVPESVVGPFFAKKQLGRAMARLDWNRDGRDDAAISHLDSPAALLTNVSEATGEFVALRLIGTTTNRDAVGTIVRVEAGERAWTNQVTAGDGYQSANEHLLRFGVADRSVLDRIEIRWFDGTTQELRDVPTGRELIVVQGRTAALIAPK